MSSHYTAAQIEVLSGLEPVRKRPGMYTDTSRPNHLVQEVVDNSVDEALAGFARRVSVRLLADGGVEVEDDGRGMPVDRHPELGIPGVEVILTRLHAGGKFSGESYRFAGGLHGVGVSVVNALSERLEVWVKREGRLHHMAFAKGEKVSDLTQLGNVARGETGTRVRFWPEVGYFDTAKVAVKPLARLLEAKAVLCPGLEIHLIDEPSGEQWVWRFDDGLGDYLMKATGDALRLPDPPFRGRFETEREGVEWALCWLP